ncbi:FliH/SctL family protein [Parasphingorhabdus cellanae]|uniref:Flagellar biosynthesis protein n=1 Tax=Parasphingorhabdus cellanae TaxID=2806553 RepID=A0ABX7T4N9_9SPHN|nr:hypothetical protein [Parasphingorhabdus cellanae]QTD55454.1 hypothetical protein J4G78_14770 [Parasphingorhabdus cellanae]
MSDLHSEKNLHGDDVVPLWRMPIEQKEFSAWSGNPAGGSTSGNHFQSFGDQEASETMAPAGDQEEDIFEAAYRKGWEDGQAAVAAERAQDDQAATNIAEAIRHLNDLHSTGSFSLILNAIESLFRRCSELAVPDPVLLQAWATQLADKIDQDQKGASLVLHPDDLALIDQDACKLVLRPDPLMLRGNLKLSHAGGWIEKGSEVVLDELHALIDEFSDPQSDSDYD